MQFDHLFFFKGHTMKSSKSKIYRFLLFIHTPESSFFDDYAQSNTSWIDDLKFLLWFVLAILVGLALAQL